MVALPRKNRDKPSEIFDAAVRIFRQKGYHAASMQDLADAVGLQKGSLYYYVASKQDLLISIYERITGAFSRQLSDLLAEPLRPSEKLARAIEIHLLALSEQLELFTVYLQEQRFLNGPLRGKIHREAERHAELLQAILREGVESGEFREVDVKMTAHAIIGMCNWLYQWYSPRGRLSPEDIAAIFADLVLNGVKAKKAKNRSRRANNGRKTDERRPALAE